MKEQRKVEEFAEKHELGAEAEFRIMDLVAEIGEIAADAAKSTDYGQNKQQLNVKEDELGDALFSLLMLASELDIDAGEALSKSLQKYEDRIEVKGNPGSD